MSTQDHVAGLNLRIASYNIRSLRDNRRAVVAVIRDIAPDVLFIQEAPRFLFWRTRCAALARRCGMRIIAGGDGACGNLILTKPEIVPQRSRVLRLPKTPGLHSRAAVLAVCEINGTEVTFVGVHSSLSATERAGHMRVLLDNLAAERGPLVLGGDLNEPPDGPSWARLREELTDAAADDDTPTFSIRSPRRRIDAIFISPALEPYEYHVWRKAPTMFASDHFPVVAHTRLPRKRAVPELPDQT